MLSQVPHATKLVLHAGQECSNSRPRAAAQGQVSCSPFGDTSAKQPCTLARGGGKQGHPLQLVLHPFSLLQHSQTLPYPHGLLPEILLFPGMFLSKIALVGLRKKKKKLDKKQQPQVMLGLGSKATLSRQETCW